MVSSLGYDIGITRSYLHLANIRGLIGNEKKREGATLNLYKKLSYPTQWNEIQIGKIDGYVNPKYINWNNKPGVTNISTTTIGSEVKEYGFDVTSYAQDLYKGYDKTIEIKASNEASTYLPNVFSSESAADKRPSITITYRDDYDVDPNLPIDTFDTEMRMFSILNKGFEAFSFDGIAKPNSQMLFELVEKGDNKVIKTGTSKGNVNKYFIDPIYITNYIIDTQNYLKGKVNYTTDYIYKDSILEFDKPYEYLVRTKNGSNISTKEFRTDAFIKYKVKTGDNLKSIAAYYGVPIETIKADNNLTISTIKEDDVLLVRFKKDNPKISKDVYTPPTKEVTYKSKYVDRGSNCVAGVCPVIDPVNVASGNYYYEDSDFTIKDAEDFSLIRYYNSTGPQLSNMFWNGFTTLMESYLSYDKEGNMLYFVGDGKIYQFDKKGDGYKVRKQDLMDVSIENGKVKIIDLKTSISYYFDEYGYLEKMISKEGVRNTITYDEYGMIRSVQVGEKKFTLTYNDRNLVQEIQLPSGKKVSYT